MRRKQLPEKLCDVVESMRFAATKVEELERQLVESQKNEMRYLWLRDHANEYQKAGPLVFLSGPRGEVYQIIHGQKLDESIDYIIDEEKKYEAMQGK